MTTTFKSLSAACSLASLSAVVGLITGTVMTDGAAADVLYDTTAMALKGTYNAARPSYIGGFADIGQFRDVQVADEFVLAETFTITSVTADFGSAIGIAPANGVLVEFFADQSGHPAEAAFIQVVADSSMYTVTNFPWVINPAGLIGMRLAIDLTAATIQLEPGTWWVSVVPVDETPTGRIYLHIRRNGQLSGLTSHARNGGQDHGTGYTGNWPSSDWQQFGTFGLSTDTGDFSLKIEGTPVALCPEDVTGNGTVDIDDLVQVITNWGPCNAPPCAADVTGNGTIDIDDLVLVITGWGACD